MENLRAAVAELDGTFAPLSDMRASAGYRTLVARNLLHKFYLEHPGETKASHPMRLDLPEELRA